MMDGTDIHLTWKMTGPGEWREGGPSAQALPRRGCSRSPAAARCLLSVPRPLLRQPRRSGRRERLSPLWETRGRGGKAMPEK